MPNPSATDLTRPPRLARAVCLQAIGLAVVAVVAGLPWARREPLPAPVPVEPTKQEVRRIRVVQLPRPPPARAEPAPPPTAPSHAVRPVAAATVRSPPKTAPEPRTRIAADSQAVHGIRLRVLVPRTAEDLASHLRNSGGCMVVSRLSGGSAEVLSVVTFDGVRALEVSGPPCNGVPRLLRDGALNDALGDPVGHVRASLPATERAGDLALQILLAPRLHDVARYALRARFGPIPEEEMARRAADAGYEITCFAEPAGTLRCI